jgi:hypothetical protein
LSNFFIALEVNPSLPDIEVEPDIRKEMATWPPTVCLCVTVVSTQLRYSAHFKTIFIEQNKTFLKGESQTFLPVFCILKQLPQDPCSMPLKPINHNPFSGLFAFLFGNFILNLTSVVKLCDVNDGAKLLERMEIDYEKNSTVPMTHCSFVLTSLHKNC